MALAAEAAELNLRALITAAPRCCTSGMKVFCSHSVSLTTADTGNEMPERFQSLITACVTSGYLQSTV